MHEYIRITYLQLILFVCGGFCSAALIPDDKIHKLRLPGGLFLLGTLVFLLYRW